MFSRFLTRASLFCSGSNAWILLVISTVVATTIYYQSSFENPFDIAVRKQIKDYEGFLNKINQIAQKTGMAPIKERRSESCITEFVRGIRPNLAQLKADHPDLKLTVAIMLNNLNFESYRRAISSVLLTTSPIFSNTEIVVIADPNSNETADIFRDLIPSNHSSKLNFRVVEFVPRKTRFQEMLEIADKFKSSDAVVFMTTDVSCTAGWLEGLLSPLLSGGENAPLIVAPYLIDTNEEESGPITQDRIHFDSQSLEKIWINLSDHKRYSTEDPTMTFMPHAFAINRKSPSFEKMMSFIVENGIGDSTSFDAAMYSWRCLNLPVLMAPCSRLYVNNYRAMSSEFEPSSMNPETKKRITKFWLDHGGLKSLKHCAN